MSEPSTNTPSPSDGPSLIPPPHAAMVKEISIGSSSSPASSDRLNSDRFSLVGRAGQALGSMGGIAVGAVSSVGSTIGSTLGGVAGSAYQGVGSVMGGLMDYAREGGKLATSVAEDLGGVTKSVTKTVAKASYQTLTGAAGIAIKAPMYAAKVPLKAGKVAAQFAAREAISVHGQLKETHQHINTVAQSAMGWDAGDARSAPLLARAGVSMIMMGQALLEPAGPVEESSTFLRVARILSTLAPVIQVAGSFVGLMRPPDSASLGFRDLQENIANAAEISVGSELSSRGLNLVNLAARRAAKNAKPVTTVQDSPIVPPLSPDHLLERISAHRRDPASIQISPLGEPATQPVMPLDQSSQSRSLSEGSKNASVRKKSRMKP